MKHITLFIFFQIFCISLVAQTIKGVVVDENNHPISNAGVTLTCQTDSTLVSGNITNSRGYFTLDYSPDKNDNPLILTIGSVGYDTYRQIINEPGDIGTISLKPSEIILAEVQVIAKRIRKTPTGYTISLTNDIRAQGVNISKTLTLLPGITKEFDVFKFNGIPISQFYLNGQKASSDDLETIPGEMLATAEISFIDNIGISKKGSVVSLTLRKPSEGGCYGNIGSGLSFRGKYYDRLSLNGIINSKFNKINLIGNIRTGNGKNTVRELYNTNYNDGRFINVEGQQLGYSNWLRPSLSVTYEITDKESLGLNVSGDFSHYNTDKELENAFSATTNNFTEYQKGHLKTNTLQGVLSYTLLTRKQGGSFKIQGEFLHRNKDVMNHYLSDNHIFDKNATQLTYTNMWNAFSRIVNPFSDALSGDLYIVWDGLQDRYQSQSTISTGDFFGNDIYNTDVIIHNPYMMAGISGKWDKFSIITRLSYQGSFLTYQISETQTNIKRKQQGFEPNVKVSYDFGKNENHTVSAEYKRIIRTFPYSLFNPNKVWQDRYHYTIGNSEILAPTENLITVSNSFWADKLYTWIGYSSIKNRPVFATYKDSELDSVTFTKPINAISENSLSFGAESNLSLFAYWQMKISANMSISEQEADFPSGKINLNSFHSFFDFTNIFGLGKGWSLYLTAYYEPTYKTYNRKYISVYGLDGSLSKTINNNISIYLDYGTGKHRKLLTYLDDGVQMYQNKTPLPYLSFSFSWKFKGGKQVNVKQTRTSKRYEEIKDK